MLKKSRRVFEWAIAFWTGIGLMSIINVIKIVYTRQTLLYDWIMFGISIIFIVICLIYLKTKKFAPTTNSKKF